ncbi:CPBP family intramembrane metalloprotease [Marinobacter sp. TBZ242]|uniref:CPBP family intramembrane metalloprotease n=1 Tax=Marinobacter azerbaijanicus TaxID=3050455 RepID=A0ABT7IHJ2_9GAMM|nr:CPBP family intramembrane glutamic endopeptidase [Marinobacter sp. TBZ242]MDL0433637.1 CPBP family intramembrane metalloprotease [Marinobacter sp. TBZ242]
MPSRGRITPPDTIPFRAIALFLILTFGIAWGILAAFIILPETMVGLFGEITGQHPLFYLAVWAPAIAAFIVVIRWSGLEGLRRHIGRALLWRCSWHWYAFLLLGVPLVFFAGSFLKGNLSDFVFPFDTAPSFLVALVFIAIKGPIEEFGWRGLALPLLQRKMAPIWAALIIGVIWGLWHTPAFLLSGTEQSAWSFLPFFTGTIALSVIVTPLFNASRGSIFLPALFHFILINPVWPDAQPYDTYLFALVALVIVWLNRRTMFTRKNSITEVVPAGREART